MTDIKTFVLLKYEIITSNQDTWVRLEKYPESVNKRWALRCARDVEHLDKTGKAKKCNDLNERYQNGELEVLHELKKTTNAAYSAANAGAAAAYYAATYVAYASAGYSATNAAYAANANATYASSTSTSTSTTKEDKWKQYIDWLIEELCDYELKQ